jgi:hypothetical protein
MPILSRQDQTGAVVNGSAEWGDMLVQCMRSGPGDTGPLLKGLPDDRCPVPHWGYLVKGRMIVRYADHEETIEAGQAFYMLPGHETMNLEECELVQFSPAAESREVLDIIRRNRQAIQQPS